MLLSPEIEQYIENHLSFEDAQLQEIEQFTKTHFASGYHMMSGKIQGAFLYLLCKILQPKHIVEIGTFTGYSTLCFAKALNADGQITTIESDICTAQQAKLFFDKFGFSTKINLLIGNAKDMLPTISDTFDFAFVDADKINIQFYIDWLLANMPSGGCMLIDNAFFHGDVVKNPIPTKAGNAMNALNQYIKTIENIETALLSIRDGLWLIRKT